jgi:CheY-like chemotaxis protein/HPt (histidine-containing phosphotransfer) domain-containing protein
MLLCTAYGRAWSPSEAPADLFDAVVDKPLTLGRLRAALTGAAASDAAPTTRAALIVPHLAGRVLLVDDNALNREVAGTLLRRGGLQVDEAVDGQQAVDRLAGAELPDLVLMDVQMPGLDGFDATRAIRRHVDAARLPIVAMTAYARQEELQRCLDAGMQDRITKPVDPTRLFAVLQRYLPARDEPATEPAADAATVPPTLAPADRADDPAMADLLNLPGLDLAFGLSRLAGQSTLYRRLLAGFLDRCGEASTTLPTLIDTGATAEAERWVHSLRGSAAMLGAGPIAAAAETLEYALAEGSETPLLAPLLQAIEALQRALEQRQSALLSDRSAPPTTQA